MRYPNLAEIPSTKEITDIFRGYNHNLRINDGEFYDMKNLSSDHYPVLAPRKPRGNYRAGNLSADTTNAQGMISKNSLFIVNHGMVYVDGYKIDPRDTFITFPNLGDGEKQLVSMGAYLIILPDKVWLNSSKIDTNDGVFILEEGVHYGYIDNSFSEISRNVTFTLGLVDGDYCSAEWTQKTAPENPSDGKLWLDTSASPCVLKRYSADSDSWTEIYTTYLRIQCTGIGKGFYKGDCVKIGQFNAVLDKDGEKPLSSRLVDELKSLAGMHTILRCEEDAITIAGNVTEPIYATTGIHVWREMPELDFVVEANNRLWGCRYGEGNDGELINEIYASKLGDFRNWNYFSGTSQDSYAASCGTDGAFTGAITYQGCPIFFKEGYMHKVYGNYPANFQVQTAACRGVQAGCSKSLAIVNEVLYYKSRTGICAYDGSLPADISYTLGGEHYTDAVAGHLGNKYYVSMKDSLDQYCLFVYDTAKGLWHKEDGTKATHFCNHKGELYYIDGDAKSVKIATGTDGDLVEWMAETGQLTQSPNKQYISRINIRMQMEFRSTVWVDIQYDSAGDWETVCVLSGKSYSKTFSIPIMPKRSEHIRMRIRGVGDAKIYSITKTIERGSDV